MTSGMGVPAVAAGAASGVEWSRGRAGCWPRRLAQRGACGGAPPPVLAPLRPARLRWPRAHCQQHRWRAEPADGVRGQQPGGRWPGPGPCVLRYQLQPLQSPQGSSVDEAGAAAGQQRGRPGVASISSQDVQRRSQSPREAAASTSAGAPVRAAEGCAEYLPAKPTRLALEDASARLCSSVQHQEVSAPAAEPASISETAARPSTQAVGQHVAAIPGRVQRVAAGILLRVSALATAVLAWLRSLPALHSRWRLNRLREAARACPGDAQKCVPPAYSDASTCACPGC